MDENYLKRTGKRVGANKMKVRLTKNGQFSTTLPKAIALAIGLKKGSIITFELLKQGGIKISNWENGESI